MYKKLLDITGPKPEMDTLSNKSDMQSSDSKHKNIKNGTENNNPTTAIQNDRTGEEVKMPKKYNRTGSLGQLVALGFGVATFTPAPYQRHRL